MTIERYRDDAIKHLQLSEQKYKGQEQSSVPLAIARRWAHAFAGREVSLDEIVTILREAEREKNQHGLTFHAFCNDMRRIYESLMQDSLDRRVNRDESPSVSHPMLEAADAQKFDEE